MDDSDDEDARPIYRSLANLPTPLISRQSSASSSVLLDADAKLTLPSSPGYSAEAELVLPAAGGAMRSSAGYSTEAELVPSEAGGAALLPTPQYSAEADLVLSEGDGRASSGRAV